MTLESAFKQAGIPKFPIAPGDVCIVPDSILNFPEGKKTEKDTRRVLVLANSKICGSYSCPAITIAPFSTKIKWASPAELFFDASNSNGLVTRSRLMLGHMQPIIKSEFATKVGHFSQEEWDEVVDHIIWNLEGK
jgi:hypothetical protein